MNSYGKLCTQYGINQRLKLFQEEGEEAVMKELQQMHDLKVVKGIEASTINSEMRKKDLNYLMVLKRKELGTVKGRGCADGRKHNKYVKKEDAARVYTSPYDVDPTRYHRGNIRCYPRHPWSYPTNRST